MFNERVLAFETLGNGVIILVCWTSYKNIQLKIEMIESFNGGNREVSLHFIDENRLNYSLFFGNVYDFRYAIENAFIDRFVNIPKETLSVNSIFTVTESEFLKNFEYQVSGTIPLTNIRHFIVCDSVDTAIELLTDLEPILLRI